MLGFSKMAQSGAILSGPNTTHYQSMKISQATNITIGEVTKFQVSTLEIRFEVSTDFCFSKK